MIGGRIKTCIIYRIYFIERNPDDEEGMLWAQFFKVNVLNAAMRQNYF